MISDVTDEQVERLHNTELRILAGLLFEEKMRLRGHSPMSVTSGCNEKHLAELLTSGLAFKRTQPCRMWAGSCRPPN